MYQTHSMSPFYLLVDHLGAQTYQLCTTSQQVIIVHSLHSRSPLCTQLTACHLCIYYTHLIVGDLYKQTQLVTRVPPHSKSPLCTHFIVGHLCVPNSQHTALCTQLTAYSSVYPTHSIQHVISVYRDTTCHLCLYYTHLKVGQVARYVGVLAGIPATNGPGSHSIVRGVGQFEGASVRRQPHQRLGSCRTTFVPVLGRVSLGREVNIVPKVHSNHKPY